MQKGNLKKCWRYEGLAFPIELRQTGNDDFHVIYGSQVKNNLSYERAADELGSCLMHALACDSLIDAKKVGER